MGAEFELRRGVAVLLTGFAVEINQRSKSARLATDDGDHQRQSERAGTRE
jgi:hypothetical protein